MPATIRPTILQAGAFAAILACSVAPASAQTAETCTAGAVEAVIRGFAAAAKADFKCARERIADAGYDCDTSEVLEKIDLEVPEVILASCPAPSSGDGLCASSAWNQYYDILRATVDAAPLPEPDKLRRKCRMALASATARLTKTRITSMRKCNERALNGVAGYGPVGADCTDLAGTPESDAARVEQKLRDSIAKRCGGPDRALGGGDDLDPQDDLGFGSQCFGETGCIAGVPELAELAECAICVARQDVEQAVTGAAALPIPQASACRAVIGRQISNLAYRSLDERVDCEKDVLEDPDAPSCPSAETMTAIAQDEASAAARITATCTGLDPQDDLGFPASCPDIGSCGATDTSDLAGEIECLRCVTAARIQVVHSALFPGSSYEADPSRQECRQAIGGEMQALVTRHFQQLERCERERSCGQATGACPDGQATRSIDLARARAAENIIGESCLSMLPEDVGFSDTCPALYACGGQSTATLAGLVTCLACIVDSTAEELTGLFVP